ncbi:MAG: hypothetical protein ACO1SV_00545 [Fimbriimonas sp.]
MEMPPLLTPRDDEHLRMLALGHRVHGTLVCLCSSVFLFHVGVGIAMLVNPQGMGLKGNEPIFAPYLFMVAGTVAVSLGWTLGVLNWMAAKRIEQRRAPTFLLVVSVLDIVFSQPLGTLLGVFSLIVMARPQVKAAFGRRA